MYEKMQTIVK